MLPFRELPLGSSSPLPPPLPSVCGNSPLHPHTPLPQLPTLSIWRQRRSYLCSARNPPRRRHSGVTGTSVEIPQPGVKGRDGKEGWGWIRGNRLVGVRKGRGRADGGVGRSVGKAAARARVNLPIPRSMRGTVHTCSAGSLEETRQPCRQEDPPARVRELGTFLSFRGVAVRGGLPEYMLTGPTKAGVLYTEPRPFWYSMTNARAGILVHCELDF